MQKRKFHRPSSVPEARKESSCQSYSASHIEWRAKRSFHRPTFIRPGFVQSRTVLLMRRQSNPITPLETWLELFWSKFNWTLYFLRAVFRFRFVACIQIQSFSGRFIFLHLSTLPRSDFPGSHGAKNITDLFCFEREHFKVFSFLCFLSWRMQTLQRARNVWRLNSQMSQDGTFVHYPFFVLNILLFILFPFSFRIFFALFVCFDILWQLATTQARDNTRNRDANSSCQNDVTWWDFFAGKQVELSLSRSLLPQKT